MGRIYSHSLYSENAASARALHFAAGMGNKANVQSGVYEIRCRATGGVYVGSSKNVARRWWQHRHDLIKNRHWNDPLQSAWNEHGAAAFDWRVLQEVDANGLRAAEKFHLEAACAAGPVFNLDMVPRGNERTRRDGGIDWRSVDWSKSNRQIARELGCSDTPVASHRPASCPSPGLRPEYLSLLGKQQMAALSVQERVERGRRLYRSRNAAGEARRIEAVRRARSKQAVFENVDWSLSNYRLARILGVAKSTVRMYRQKRADGA